MRIFVIRVNTLHYVEHNVRLAEALKIPSKQIAQGKLHIQVRRENVGSVKRTADIVRGALTTGVPRGSKGFQTRRVPRGSFLRNVLIVRHD